MGRLSVRLNNVVAIGADFVCCSENNLLTQPHTSPLTSLDFPEYYVFISLSYRRNWIIWWPIAGRHNVEYSRQALMEEWQAVLLRPLTFRDMGNFTNEGKAFIYVYRLIY